MTFIPEKDYNPGVIKLTPEERLQALAEEVQADLRVTKAKADASDRELKERQRKAREARR